MEVQPTHLCIISRHPLRGGHFAAALQASLGPEDYLDIIMDRRHVGFSGKADLKNDRRRQPQVDLALEANGFAIVPASPSLLDEEDEARLESIQNFPRQQSSTLIPKLLGVLSGVTLVALVGLLVGHLTGQSLLSQLFTGPLSGGADQPPGQTRESSALARSSAVTEEPVIAETRPARPEAAPPASPNSESPSKGPSEVIGAGTGQGASGARPKVGATARQSSNAPPLSNQVAGAPPAGTATPKPTPERVGHRAELVGEPVSRGWGDSYAVRLLDPAGRPMVVTAVLLVARMADGTVEKIPMGALPEPGTYRGTVPTGRSTPVNLRVRMTTGDESREVPVRPSREKS